MLQQTRVSTVIPYFDRWLKRFPGFSELAETDEEEVLSLWQGLGYYSRARNLHRLAREVIHSGLPADLKGWKSLPGIGPYSAAAVGSIAQGLPVAVVDGNVVRVLARWTGDESRWKGSAEAVKAIGPRAEAFLDRQNPGRHNEAVMELGALVCLPRSPLCTICPLVQSCEAAAKGMTDRIPQIGKPGKKEKTIRRAWAFSEGRLLLWRHPGNSSRLAGLMELPQLTDLPDGFVPEEAPLAKRKRGIGNESITEWIHRARVRPDVPLTPLEPGLEWVELSDLARKPLSGPHRRWIEQLLVSQNLVDSRFSDRMRS